MDACSSKDAASELMRLMLSAEHNELECKRILVEARERLVRATPLRFYSQEEELRGYFGDSDYMVRCVDLDDAGRERNLAYLWEVKAPQCYLFTKDTKSRAKPTWDLISAENQLLHYFHNLCNSQDILKDFKIFQGDLHFGGIIIGSSKNIVENKYENTEEGMRLALHALELRKQYFYRPQEIEVITWDRIVEHLQKGVRENEVEKGKETITKELRTNPPDINIHVIEGGTVQVGEKAYT